MVNLEGSGFWVRSFGFWGKQLKDKQHSDKQRAINSETKGL